MSTSGAPRLCKGPSSTTNDVNAMPRILRLTQERARDQRAEKRAAKKEEKRLVAEELKAKVFYRVLSASAS